MRQEKMDGYGVPLRAILDRAWIEEVCMSTLTRSRGATEVLAMAPARPPAVKERTQAEKGEMSAAEGGGDGSAALDTGVDKTEETSMAAAAVGRGVEAGAAAGAPPVADEVVVGSVDIAADVEVGCVDMPRRSGGDRAGGGCTAGGTAPEAEAVEAAGGWGCPPESAASVRAAMTETTGAGKEGTTSRLAGTV